MTQRPTQEQYAQPTRYVAPEKFDKMFALYVAGLSRISASAKAVAAALIWHANSKTGRCDPGQKRLAYETRLSRRTVRKAVTELLKRGFILFARVRRGYRTNAYQINWPGLRRAFEEFEQRVLECRDVI